MDWLAYFNRPQGFRTPTPTKEEMDAQRNREDRKVMAWRQAARDQDRKIKLGTKTEKFKLTLGDLAKQ